MCVSSSLFKFNNFKKQFHMHLHIALYPYDGSTEDGLVLVPGDEIDVTVDDIGDGWSQGKNLTTGKSDSSLSSPPHL